MAIYHFLIKIGSRSKGKSAIAASAYRSSEKLVNNETGLVADFTQKKGTVFSEIILCQNAPNEYSNRGVLWNAVHQIEKSKNARLYREFEVALPRELNREQQIETVRYFVKGLTHKGMCVDWALHDKKNGNPHAHIMATTRSICENGKWAPKSRKVYDLDDNGKKIYLGKDKSGRRIYKNHKEDYNDWNSRKYAEEWRLEWEQCCNRMLSVDNYIDHRSYKRQNVELIPTIHEGYIARKIENRGGISDICSKNRNIKKANNSLMESKKLLNDIRKEKMKLEEEEYEQIEQLLSDAENVNRVAGTENYNSESDRRKYEAEKNQQEIKRYEYGNREKISKQKRRNSEVERKNRDAEQIRLGAERSRKEEERRKRDAEIRRRNEERCRREREETERRKRTIRNFKSGPHI